MESEDEGSLKKPFSNVFYQQTGLNAFAWNANEQLAL